MVAQMIKNQPTMQETQAPSWFGKIPWGRNGSPLQYSCWRIPWTKEPGRVHGVAKSWTQLTNIFTFTFRLNKSQNCDTFQNNLIKSFRCFPDSSVGKESACNAGDPASILGLGRIPGEGID